MKRAGFTLIEITIAVGILGVVIVIVYGVFARTLAGKEYTEGRAMEMAAVRSVLNRMVRDLQNVRSRGGTPNPQATPTPSAGLPKSTEQILFVSRNRTDGGVPFDDLMFSAVLRRPAALALSSADLAVVRYFVESDPANPNHRVLYRESVFSLSGQVFDPEKPDPASTIRILDGVAGLEFRFFDGREWVQEWDSGDPRNFGPAPQAVEISLALQSDRSEPEVFRTAIDLPPTAAAPATGAPTPGSGSDEP